MKKIVTITLSLIIIVFTIINTSAIGDSDSSSTDLSEKSVIFVGDSLTYGSGTTKTYHSYIKNMGIFESVQAMGVAGSCISTTSDYGNLCSPLVQRYTSIPETDIIVIFMGTNDYSHETPLGAIDDTTDISFYGALNVIIPGIKALHPDSQLVFVTPLHRYGFGTSKITGNQFTYDNIPNGRNHSLSDYVEAIISVCKQYSVPLIDLFNQFPIDPSNSADRVAYMPDGLHPNTIGHEIIANLLLQNLQFINNNTKPDVHTHSYMPIVIAPTCIDQGYTIHICMCGNMIKDSFAEVSDHSFSESVCKNCNKKCDCMCHQSGFKQILWKLLNFFHKLFRINKTCDCRMIHY